MSVTITRDATNAVITAFVRQHPETPVDVLRTTFPGIDAWTLRSLRREALKDAAFQTVPEETVLQSAALADLSPLAKTALRAGFFRPVQFTYEERRPVKPIFKKAGHEILVLPDIHAGGEEDPDALDVAVQVGQAIDADEIVFAGDGFDAHSVSKYTPSAERAARWVDERAAALPVLAAVRAAFAKKPATWLHGNHDTRPSRYVDAVAPQLQGLFTLPQLLGIDNLDLTFPEDNRVVVADKLLIIHGEKVRKDAGASVKAEVQDYGMSVAIGHVHRRAFYEVTTTAQEVRGEQPLIGVEMGCLCSLSPSYLARERTANWQHGAAVVTVYDDGLFDIEQIRIFRGRATFRGTVFESRVRKAD